jgi:hypothetical protein
LGVQIIEEVGTRHGALGVRIGVHTGPAVHRDGDWFGPPGSAAIQEHRRTRRGLRTHALGPAKCVGPARRSCLPDGGGPGSLVGTARLSRSRAPLLLSRVRRDLRSPSRALRSRHPLRKWRATGLRSRPPTSRRPSLASLCQGPADRRSARGACGARLRSADPGRTACGHTRPAPSEAAPRSHFAPRPGDQATLSPGAPPARAR